MTLTTSQYVFKAKAIHGSRYDYSIARYVRSNAFIEIICKIHGAFSCRADAHLRGGNCPACSDITRVDVLSLSRADVLSRLRKHTSGFVRIDKSDNVVIDCPTHGRVRVPHKKSKHSYNCPNCSYQARLRTTLKTNADFIAEARAVHGLKYDYNKVDYVRTGSHVIITCAKHSDFYQTPNSHLQRRGCPGCCTHGYSRMAIDWITREARRLHLHCVQHALNGGEYILPGTRIKVDGFHAPTNTVFEFHGDYFHGNPKTCDPFSKPHPFNDKLALRLYLETKARESKIRSLGYNLVVMWENDYRRHVK